jgi:hypothetical protein
MGCEWGEAEEKGGVIDELIVFSLLTINCYMCMS